MAGRVAGRVAGRPFAVVRAEPVAVGRPAAALGDLGGGQRVQPAAGGGQPVPHGVKGGPQVGGVPVERLPGQGGRPRLGGEGPAAVVRLAEPPGQPLPSSGVVLLDGQQLQRVVQQPGALAGGEAARPVLRPGGGPGVLAQHPRDEPQAVQPLGEPVGLPPPFPGGRRRPGVALPDQGLLAGQPVHLRGGAGEQARGRVGGGRPGGEHRRRRDGEYAQDQAAVAAEAAAGAVRTRPAAAWMGTLKAAHGRDRDPGSGRSASAGGPFRGRPDGPAGAARTPGTPRPAGTAGTPGTPAPPSPSRYNGASHTTRV
ncbi:hypothetical protein ACSNOK_05605, partial [Streptomyces sp. URMC 126]